MPARMPVVRRTATFEAQLLELQSEGYEEIGKVIDSFCNLLALAQVDTPALSEPGESGVFAHYVDYPPFRERGQNRFRVTFAVRRGTHPMRDPDQFAMLTIRVAKQLMN
jgi:hypothetical protein